MSAQLTLAMHALLAERHLVQDCLEGRLVHAGLEPPRDAGEVLAEGFVKHLQPRDFAEGTVQSTSCHPKMSNKETPAIPLQGLPVPTQMSPIEGLTAISKGYEPQQPTFVKPLNRLHTPTMSASVTRSPTRNVRLVK